MPTLVTGLFGTRPGSQAVTFSDLDPFHGDQQITSPLDNHRNFREAHIGWSAPQPRTNLDNVKDTDECLLACAVDKMSLEPIPEPRDVRASITITLRLPWSRRSTRRSRSSSTTRRDNSSSRSRSASLSSTIGDSSLSSCDANIDGDKEADTCSKSSSSISTSVGDNYALPAHANNKHADHDSSADAVSNTASVQNTSRRFFLHPLNSLTSSFGRPQGSNLHNLSPVNEIIDIEDIAETGTANTMFDLIENDSSSDKSQPIVGADNSPSGNLSPNNDPPAVVTGRPKKSTLWLQTPHGPIMNPLASHRTHQSQLPRQIETSNLSTSSQALDSKDVYDHLTAVQHTNSAKSTCTPNKLKARRRSRSGPGLNTTSIMRSASKLDKNRNSSQRPQGHRRDLNRNPGRRRSASCELLKEYAIHHTTGRPAHTHALSYSSDSTNSSPRSQNSEYQVGSPCSPPTSVSSFETQCGAEVSLSSPDEEHSSRRTRASVSHRKPSISSSFQKVSGHSTHRIDRNKSLQDIYSVSTSNKDLSSSMTAQVHRSRCSSTSRIDQRGTNEDVHDDDQLQATAPQDRSRSNVTSSWNNWISQAHAARFGSRGTGTATTAAGGPGAELDTKMQTKSKAQTVQDSREADALQDELWY